jgi:NAD(P)H-hydrate epimerase
MKIFTSEQIRLIDKYTIENEPIASIDLMERAAGQITGWLMDHYDKRHFFVIFTGPGNNGGDGLAVARMLLDHAYGVRVYNIRISAALSPDALNNFKRLGMMEKAEIVDISEKDSLPVLKGTEIILDAVFGSGLNRPADGLAARVIRYLNSLPNTKIAIDIPSGLFGEDNSGNNFDTILQADITLTLQFPKLSFFFSENEKYTGRWEVLPIGLSPDAIRESTTPYGFILTDDVLRLLKKRTKFSHKGTFGNVLLIAGSYGMMGAAVLAARAALRTGSGLVRVHIPAFGYPILQTAVPEALISLDELDTNFSGVPELDPYNAFGVGPGLGSGKQTQQALFDFLKKGKGPVVIDADGLNILAANKKWLYSLSPQTVLTPHPKEFDRLAGKSGSGYERNQQQIKFAKKYKVIVVLKGAYTSIALPDGSCYFNSTGNAGMATAGSGDVLTGIILSLLGQGYRPEDAAMVGVYLHGLAGDLAAEAGSEESVIAGDIIENIGRAFRRIRESPACRQAGEP